VLLCCNLRRNEEINLVLCEVEKEAGFCSEAFLSVGGDTNR
jgi:hypothetical protein